MKVIEIGKGKNFHSCWEKNGHRWTSDFEYSYNPQDGFKSFTYQGVDYEYDEDTNRYYYLTESNNLRPEMDGAMVRSRIGKARYMEIYEQLLEYLGMNEEDTEETTEETEETAETSESEEPKTETTETATETEPETATDPETAETEATTEETTESVITMKEIKVAEAMNRKYVLIDMVHPVKGYESYDFHVGTKCKINGYPFQIMAENGELSFEAGAIALTAWKRPAEDVVKFVCNEKIAIICVYEGYAKAYEYILPKKIKQQSFIIK